MLVTEKEAETKWCPFHRSWKGIAGVAAAINHASCADGSERRSPCIGSDCMMWRWRDDAKIERDFPVGVVPPVEEGWIESVSDGVRTVVNYGNGPMVTYSRPNNERRGHCGLAGKP